MLATTKSVSLPVTNRNSARGSRAANDRYYETKIESCVGDVLVASYQHRIRGRLPDAIESICMRSAIRDACHPLPTETVWGFTQS